MKELLNKVHTRRQLITRALRNASLALLGAGGGAVVVKRRRLLREGRCLNQGICRDCTVFDECGLPRALSVRSRASVGSGPHRRYIACGSPSQSRHIAIEVPVPARRESSCEDARPTEDS